MGMERAAIPTVFSQTTHNFAHLDTATTAFTPTTSKMKIIASLLFLLPSVALARELAAESKRLGAPSNHRDLQDLGLLCGALFDEILADSPITCSCLPVRKNNP